MIWGTLGDISMEMKRCSDCDDVRPVSEFGKNRSTKDGLTCYCREHMYARTKAWRLANPERTREIKQRSTRKGLYGLSHEQYDALFDAQDGLCPVCSEPLGKRAHIDHDHETGEVRGILHGSCNLLLGHAHENPATLRAAADYIEKVRS